MSPQDQGSRPNRDRRYLRHEWKLEALKFLGERARPNADVSRQKTPHGRLYELWHATKDVFHKFGSTNATCDLGVRGDGRWDDLVWTASMTICEAVGDQLRGDEARMLLSRAIADITLARQTKRYRRAAVLSDIVGGLVEVGNLLSEPDA